MGVFYAIKRACTNKSWRVSANAWLSRLVMSFFTMSTMKHGLRPFSERILRTAAYILRRVRFLETAVLKVFFGAVGENLKAAAGTCFTEKKGEYDSRPVLTTRSNSFTERRSTFESMVYRLNRELAATLRATALYDVLACRRLYPFAKTVGTGALSLFWIICE